MNISYDRNFYGFDKNFLQDVNRIENKKAFLTISLTWLSIYLIELIATHFVGSTYFWLFYIPLIFIIAGRQGVLLQLVHEGAHTLLNSNKNTNDFLSNYFCALPLGLTHQGYKVGHYEHHLHTGTQLDPPSDREKYKFTDMTKGDMYLLFLKDLSGISALSVFFAYGNNAVVDKSASEQVTSGVISKVVQRFFPLLVVQAIILLLIFKLDVINYILFWIIPAISPHMFLMRIRGIAEHGLSNQLGINISDNRQGNLYTRSFLSARKVNNPLLSWLEKVLIGSLDVHYHHEHHLLPNVPHYNLKKVHEKIYQKAIILNPNIFVSGYFKAAFNPENIK